MPLAQLSGSLGHKRAAHLLRRATFGATLESIDHFATLDAERAVQELFNGRLDEPEPPIDPKTGDEWITFPTTEANSDEGALQSYFKAWCLKQIFSGNGNIQEKVSYSLREKITFFLHTHFTTMVNVVNNSKFLYFQNVLFRKYAFDKESGSDVNFKELAKKISVDNAMLVFLDGRLNVKGSPNENYARELLELYTIGKGLEGSIPPDLEIGDYYYFTEDDVKAAARVLSGWDTDRDLLNIDPDTEIPRGKVKGGATASSHDNDPKQFSNRFNNTVIAPDPLLLDAGRPTEESAFDEISQLIDMIFDQEETARHICRKLYRFFVYHTITAEIEANVISVLAQTLKDNDFKIQAVIEDLFKSGHFYEGSDGAIDNNFGGIIKSPLDLAAGTLNFFGVELPDYETDLENFYIISDTIIRMMELQGFNFYEPVEVAGYPAYHQFPIFNRNWISTNYLTRRYEFIRKILSPMNMQEYEPLKINLLEYIKGTVPFGIASNARSLIIYLATYLLPNNEELTFDRETDDNAEITAERLNFFLQTFLYEPQLDADPEEAWTLRYTGDLDVEVLQRQLESLLNGLLQTPEYQLM